MQVNSFYGILKYWRSSGLLKEGSIRHFTKRTVYNLNWGSWFKKKKNKTITNKEIKTKTVTVSFEFRLRRHSERKKLAGWGGIKEKVPSAWSSHRPAADPGGLRGRRAGQASRTTAPEPPRHVVPAARSPRRGRETRGGRAHRLLPSALLPRPEGLLRPQVQPQRHMEGARSRPSGGALLAPASRRPRPRCSSLPPPRPFSSLPSALPGRRPRSPAGGGRAAAGPGRACPLSLTCQSQLDGPVPPGPLAGHVPGRPAGSALPCPGLPLPLGPGRETGGGQAPMESGWALRAAAAAGEARMCPASPWAGPGPRRRRRRRRGRLPRFPSLRFPAPSPGARAASTTKPGTGPHGGRADGQTAAPRRLAWPGLASPPPGRPGLPPGEAAPPPAPRAPRRAGGARGAAPRPAPGSGRRCSERERRQVAPTLGVLLGRGAAGVGWRWSCGWGLGHGNQRQNWEKTSGENSKLVWNVGSPGGACFTRAGAWRTGRTNLLLGRMNLSPALCGNQQPSSPSCHSQNKEG